jgi:hypothetical protein
MVRIVNQSRRQWSREPVHFENHWSDGETSGPENEIMMIDFDENSSIQLLMNMH